MAIVPRIRIVAQDGKTPAPVATVFRRFVPGREVVQHIVWFPTQPVDILLKEAFRHLPKQFIEQQFDQKTLLYEHDEDGHYILFLGTYESPWHMLAALRSVGIDVAMQDSEYIGDDVLVYDDSRHAPNRLPKRKVRRTPAA